MEECRVGVEVSGSGGGSEFPRTPEYEKEIACWTVLRVLSHYVTYFLDPSWGLRFRGEG